MSDDSTLTPGPWKLGRLRSDTVLDQDGNYVADCGVSMILPPAEQLVNARLVAAAPDLFRALSLLLSSPTDPWSHRRARAALAKAKGGEA